MTRDDFRQGPITVTAYDWVPGFAQGFVRDLRVRWALEEAGFPYDIEVLAQGTQGEDANLSRQPFGQIPTLTVGERTMFESGAIVWRIAEASEALLPTDPAHRDECLSWYFAAIDSVEGGVNMLAFLRLFADEEKDAAARIEPLAARFLAQRLTRLADALGTREHLVANRFTVADLMMTFVLRNVEATGDLDAVPAIRAYVARHSARPAFRKALAAQIETHRANAARYETAA